LQHKNIKIELHKNPKNSKESEKNPQGIVLDFLSTQGKTLSSTSDLKKCPAYLGKGKVGNFDRYSKTYQIHPRHQILKMFMPLK
jgi:hypothetical protein